MVDAHTHLPLEPPREPDQLLGELARAGVGGAVILGVPPAREVLERVGFDDVVREYERARGVIERYASSLAELLRPEALYISVVDLLRRYGTLCSYPPRGRGYVILAAADLSLEPDVLAERLERLAGDGYAGFKVISTLQFRFLDSPQVEAVLDVAESRGLAVVVHAGCDPGIWELPRYCRYGDPSRLGPLLERHRDVPVVIAHMGGYSAIAPGVFTQEAVELARRFPNVYLDTSAVPGFLVKRVAQAVPRGRILFGTDYPVVDYGDVVTLRLVVERSLRSAGYNSAEVEAALHGLAEELFGVRCH